MFSLAGFCSLAVGAITALVLGEVFFGNWKKGIQCLANWFRPVEFPDDDSADNQNLVGHLAFIAVVLGSVGLTYTCLKYFLNE